MNNYYITLITASGQFSFNLRFYSYASLFADKIRLRLTNVGMQIVLDFQNHESAKLEFEKLQEHLKIYQNLWKPITSSDRKLLIGLNIPQDFQRHYVMLCLGNLSLIVILRLPWNIMRMIDIFFLSVLGNSLTIR